MDQIVMDSAAEGSSHEQKTSEPEFDLRRYWSAFRKYTWTFIITSAVVFIAVAVVTFLLTPLYTATSRVVIDPRLQAAVDTSANASQPSSVIAKPSEAGMVDSEVEDLKSRALTEQVIAALHLDRDPEFNKDINPTFIHNLLASLRPKPSAIGEHLAVVDAVMKAADAQRSGETYVMDVKFTSQDPDKAALIAQTYADIYVSQSAKVKAQATGTASDVLSLQLDKLRRDAETADAAVQQYRTAHGLLSAEGSSLTEQEIARLNLDLSSEKEDLAEATARLNTAEQQMKRGAGDDVGEALSSPVVMNLRVQRATVSRSLADLQTRYGPRHPEVLQAQQQLHDIDNQIKIEINRIVSNLKAQAQIAQEKVSAAEGNLSSSRSVLAQNGAAAVELNALMLKADSARQVYQAFLNRYQLTAQQTQVQQSDARILAKAEPPTQPSFPNKPIFLALGVVLAAAAGAGMVVLRNMLDAGLSTSEQVEQKLGVQFLGSVPLMDRGPAQRRAVARLVVDSPVSAYADSMRNVRASILFSRPGTDVRTVALTSALPGEGKTTTAISMARSAALSGASCILIDCDVRRAASARALELRPEKGLVELLRGEATLQEVLVRDTLSNAVFLPIAAPRSDADDLVSTPAMLRLISELKKQYQFVFLDTGPVLAVADTRVLASAVDVTVVLTHWRKTPRKATAAAIRLLNDVDAFVAGVVLTQVNLKEQAKSGYGDATYYYEHYRHYYAQ